MLFVTVYIPASALNPTNLPVKLRITSSRLLSLNMSGYYNGSPDYQGYQGSYNYSGSQGRYNGSPPAPNSVHSSKPTEHGWTYTGSNQTSRVEFYEKDNVRMDYYPTTGACRVL